MHATELIPLIGASLAAGYGWYRLPVQATFRELMASYRQALSTLDAPQIELVRQAGRQFCLLGLLALQLFLLASPLLVLLAWWHFSGRDTVRLLEPWPLLLSTLALLGVALAKRGIHSGYSGYAMLLHRFAMGFPSAARAGLDLALSRIGPVAPPEDAVYITGLSRCGSTALLQHLYGTGAYAPLRYADMPFPLMPGFRLSS